MTWSTGRGRFVVLASILLLAWYVSVLLETNAGWGWRDPEYAVFWKGRQLARWTSVLAAASLMGAAIWRPATWTILAPAFAAVLGLVIRRLYLIESPPDYFLADQASTRWYFAGLCLLQLVAFGLTRVSPARREV